MTELEATMATLHQEQADRAHVIEAIRRNPAARAMFCARVPLHELKKHALNTLYEIMKECLHYVPLQTGLYDA